MFNKNFVKKNLILSTTLMIMFSFFISACGNNDSTNSNESTAPTTTLTYKESIEESMEKESIKKESFESLKESKRIEDESKDESLNNFVAEVESMREEESKYRETRDEYIKNKRESIKNINIDEIVDAYRESRDNEEVTNEN